MTEKEGWRATAFGERYDHYFKMDEVCNKYFRPLCGSNATFTTSPARKYARGITCPRCLKKLCVDEKTAKGMKYVTEECRRCDGIGDISRDGEGYAYKTPRPCPLCEGKGVTSRWTNNVEQML